MQLDLVAQIGGSLISIMFPLVCIWYTHDFQQFYKLCLRKAQLDKLVCLMYVIIIQRWFTLYNSNVNLWFTLFSHICLHNPSYLFIYSRLLRYFVIFFVKKKKSHLLLLGFQKPHFVSRMTSYERYPFCMDHSTWLTNDVWFPICD